VAAIVNVCVDPRLDHAVIRAQVRARLERMHLPARMIYVTNEIGANVGANFRSTAELVIKNRDTIDLAAVLHHDDCVADRLGLRKRLPESVEGLRRVLADLKVSCPVLAGQLRTEHNSLTWADEPRPSYEVLNFRMPRLSG